MTDQELIEELFVTFAKATDTMTARAAAPAAARLLIQIVQRKSAAPTEMIDFLQQELADLLGY